MNTSGPIGNPPEILNNPASEYSTPPPQPANIRLGIQTNRVIVTYILLGICIAFYLLQVLSELLTGIDLPYIYGGKINELIIQLQMWRLFTPMFLHGSVIHLALNMYGLLILGRNVESFFGKWRFLALFISAGFAGNTLSFLLSPNPSLGSSTAIFGLLAAEAVFVYQNRKFFGSRSRSILINSAIVAAMNLALGLNPGIDNWGHLGGLLGGLLFTFIGGPRWRVEGILPQLEIRDTSTPVRTWFALAAVIVLFGVMAALRILSS